MAEPVPQGIFRAVERPMLHELMDAQIDQARREKPADAMPLPQNDSLRAALVKGASRAAQNIR